MQFGVSLMNQDATPKAGDFSKKDVRVLHESFFSMKITNNQHFCSLHFDFLQKNGRFGSATTFTVHLASSASSNSVVGKLSDKGSQTDFCIKPRPNEF